LSTSSTVKPKYAQRGPGPNPGNAHRLPPVEAQVERRTTRPGPNRGNAAQGGRRLLQRPPRATRAGDETGNADQRFLACGVEFLRATGSGGSPGTLQPWQDRPRYRVRRKRGPGGARQCPAPALPGAGCRTSLNKGRGRPLATPPNSRWIPGSCPPCKRGPRTNPGNVWTPTTWPWATPTPRNPGNAQVVSMRLNSRLHRATRARDEPGNAILCRLAVPAHQSSPNEGRGRTPATPSWVARSANPVGFAQRGPGKNPATPRLLLFSSPQPRPRNEGRSRTGNIRRQCGRDGRA
jgi:hypothetical protein